VTFIIKHPNYFDDVSRAMKSLYAIILKVFFNLIMMERVETAEPIAMDSSKTVNEEKATELLTLYGNNILRLAYSYLHNLSDAEDVLQDTLIQFLKTKPSFETTSHEKAWLLRVAINISKNKLSYNKIRKTDELCETLAADEDEDLSFVWEAVKALPPKYSEVIHLYYHESYSTSQIASILSTKESTVRSLLLRARNKLKLVLKEAYDFGE